MTTTPTAAEDVKALIMAVDTRPDVDGTRWAIVGSSFAGYLVNWLVTDTDFFRAGVSHAGWASMEMLARTTDGPYQEDRWGPHDRRSEEWYRWHSLDERADWGNAPLLISHGGLDEVAPVDAAVWWWRSLNLRPGGPPEGSRFMVFPDEDHYVDRPPNSNFWYREVLAFIRRHLRPAPGDSSDPPRGGPPAGSPPGANGLFDTRWDDPKGRGSTGGPGATSHPAA